MSWRFRRSVKIAPGVKLNFGKRGVSTSFGVHGAHVTVGKNRVTRTVGVPGTGIYNTKTYSTSSSRGKSGQSKRPAETASTSKPATAKDFQASGIFFKIMAAVFIILGVLICTFMWPLGLIMITVGVLLFLKGRKDTQNAKKMKNQNGIDLS